jgi:hypothetical protein
MGDRPPGQSWNSGFASLHVRRAHALTFGLASSLIWAWDAAEGAPTLRAWVLLGAILGLLTMTRWQAIVFLLLVGPLAIKAS